ncbi:hypothetical protein ACIG0C_33370 [Kitasatospora aureofaciens]|uniref:Uncharacterized protein n=1 Tax=Kitasatospora aureofaciens TaxID=1894 RepID=A0A1E7NF33_KITAU|nr:hypothetical protein [Kitasatospora aureofaciens]ARF83324.1 hypothetical protein B6264_30860 [Kitasatospora aureofaciens]OEV39093.1 hypothetical protein HS99_0018585 [Kitasatospora aureofaciens]GGV04466.1 hypothetical protein GCM10010502_68990 [Kitasatospora aureofaciens]
MISIVETDSSPDEAGGPVDEVLRRVRQQVPDLVIGGVSSAGARVCVTVRIEGSLDPVELEYWAEGRPPFTTADEYSSIAAADPTAAAEAVLSLLRA